MRGKIILERFFLGGFTSAARCNYGEGVKNDFWLTGKRSSIKENFKVTLCCRQGGHVTTPRKQQTVRTLNHRPHKFLPIA